MKKTFIPVLFIILFIGCENRAVNEGEEFRPNEVSEDYKDFHFNTIKYEGLEYLITERDNNNPHEGFGFMALKGKSIIEQQDTVLAYLQSLSIMQSKMYAKLFSISEERSDSLFKSYFIKQLNSLNDEK